MTEKQIRTALKNLLERRCIRHADIKRSFDRTVRFQVSNEIYQAYFTAAVGGGLCVGIS
jgi:hypothetical protein